MRDQISLRCSCGKMRGHVKELERLASRRVVCLCDDCQAYAHYLNCASSVLDSQGGTDILPVYPSQLRITQGISELRCLRLSQKGILRWYATCCRTPLANTPPSKKLAYAGVIHCIIDHAADGTTADEALGPIDSRIQGKFGLKPLHPGTHEEVPLYLKFRIFRFLLKGWIKSYDDPSPFFDDKGEPKVKPYVLTSVEREELRRLCGPGKSVRA